MIRPLLAIALIALAAPAARAETQTALLAGGCFWCVESDLDHVRGVISTTSGYAGGRSAHPTYQTYETDGHRETVEVRFDPAVISYHDLVATFLRTIDVTDEGGQFCDRGHGYTTAIYALDPGQDREARSAIAEAEASLHQSVATVVEGAVPFTPAESYHQDYYLGQDHVLTRFGYITQAEAYQNYRKGCGRDAQVMAVWGDQAYRGIDHAM